MISQQTSSSKAPNRTISFPATHLTINALKLTAPGNKTLLALNAVPPNVSQLSHLSFISAKQPAFT
jgi:hypothetical protein